MQLPTIEQMNEILDTKLARDYPCDSVELGEGWELIAEIFYKAGFEAASKGEQNMSEDKMREEQRESDSATRTQYQKRLWHLFCVGRF